MFVLFVLCFCGVFTVFVIDFCAGGRLTAVRGSFTARLAASWQQRAKSCLERRRFLFQRSESRLVALLIAFFPFLVKRLFRQRRSE